jgi:hypothetical protein
VRALKDKKVIKSEYNEISPLKTSHQERLISIGKAEECKKFKNQISRSSKRSENPAGTRYSITKI